MVVVTSTAVVGMVLAVSSKKKEATPYQACNAKLNQSNTEANWQEGMAARNLKSIFIRCILTIISAQTLEKLRLCSVCALVICTLFTPFNQTLSGEVATARAAAACNTIMVYKRRDLTTMLVQRAERYGFKAMILTVDSPRLGRREADIKNRMIAPQLKNFEGLLSTRVASDKGSNLEAYAAETLDPSVCWKDIEWLRSITSLPIIIKGVLTAEDAIKAMEAGVAEIVVSNHGARQLDYSPATITVLEEVVRAVLGKIPVLIDGGVRRGTDIFKALALGAQAVLVNSDYWKANPLWIGSKEGEYGVRQVIEMLKDELELTMALSGCPTLKDITRSHVRTEQDRFNCRL
ncbi:hypothetical protein Vadar_021293 [Vaccinium darrowii]|uniref:Uncharacterized protein n=1 Tax=Vaccinium darrowii TaxID=229202 RepID=A0ACB7ZKW7_9ERIC|nr:hypothetical protein Vadar_021293 [Vaccinium darrowii]